MKTETQKALFAAAKSIDDLRHIGAVNMSEKEYDTYGAQVYNLRRIAGEEQ